MIKEFLMRQAIKHQTKNMSDAQRNQMMTLIEKNPKLFETIAKEIDVRVKKGGEDQTSASMNVMKKYREELSSILQPK